VVAGPGTGRQLLVEQGGETRGDLGSPQLQRRVAQGAADALASLESGRASVETPGGVVDLFIEIHPPPPKLVLVGAVHVAVHLVTFAKALGFHTTVIDPRTAFATRERLAAVDQLIPLWPQKALADLSLDEGTYFAVLSHDPKLDLPALRVALRCPLRYIGALGSTRTHAQRVAALLEDGFSDQEIARIHAPIGLDLGGRRAEEIAVAILAEIVAVSHGRKLVRAPACDTSSSARG
jgi:xanthine dehydrogenase accessory factor